MGPDPRTGMYTRPLERFASSCGWFRGQLLDNDVRLHDGSSLNRALAELEEFRRAVVQDDHFHSESTDAAYDRMSEIYGADFLTKAVHWGHAKGLRLPRDRWQMLAQSDPLLTRRTDVSERKRNQTWETVIGSIAATFAQDVTFAEPDVTCRFGGRTFAVAAKVAYSSANVVDNIEKGFKQARSKAEAVLVFVDAVSIYPQVDTLRWSRSRNFHHNAEAVEVITASVLRWCDRWPLERLAAWLRTQATEPVGVAFFVPMLIHLDHAPRPFFYTHMPLMYAPGSPDYEFATAFLRACNVVADFEAPAR